jgi:hypothetical protein
MPENTTSLNCNVKNKHIFSVKCHSLQKDSFIMENSDMSTQFLVPYIMIIIADESFLLPENSMKIFRNAAQLQFFHRHLTRRR